MSRKALIIAADGTEESELVIVADLLRRAEVDVTIANINGDGQMITCSRNVRIVCDCSLESVQDKIYDCVILPGGLVGTEALCKSELAAKVVKKHEMDVKLVAAICAAPLALKAYGVFNYKYVTSHPSVKGLLLTDSTFQYKEERVVEDENLITSRGPGTAFEFAIAILKVLVGKDKTMKVINPLILGKSADKDEYSDLNLGKPRNRLAEIIQ